jgi:thymidylate synthase
MGLGVPFNIACYSLFTLMIAQVCNLQPGEFIHCTGDTHVYINHVEPLLIQLKNEPYPFPTVELDKSITDIDKFTIESIVLKDYKSHKAIKMEMAV